MNDDFLLADVGGTFTRFILAGAQGLNGVPTVYESASYPRFEDAAIAFLTETGAKPAHVGIAAAGPVMDGEIQMTNGPRWHIAPATVKAVLGAMTVVLVNDFAAMAAGAPLVGPERLVQIADGKAEASGSIAVIGPGTGLGVALLTPDGHGQRHVLPTEGGNASLAPSNDREIAVMFQLIRRFGFVKAEYVLSGTGLEILWETLAGLDGVPMTPKPTAGEIAERARRGSDPLAVETVSIFTGWLGSFCGDVVLLTGATGGVFLGGGVLPRWTTLFDKVLFHRRFLAKGSHMALMERVPIQLIMDPEASLLGMLALTREAAA